MTSDPIPDVADEPDLGELFHTAFRGLRRRWTHELAPFEMTPHQWRALNTLARGCGPCTPAQGRDTAEAPHADTNTPEGSLRLKELADLLRIAPRSATEVVDQLEAKKLVERTADPQDRRAVLIRLTGSGKVLRGRVEQSRRQQANEYFARLESEERNELARLLGVLAGTEPAEQHT